MKHKNSAGFSSFSTRREEHDEYFVKATTSVLTLSDERVGSGEDDVDLITSTSLFKRRVGSTKDGLGLTTSISLFNGRVGSTTNETESTTWSTNGGSRKNL